MVPPLRIPDPPLNREVWNQLTEDATVAEVPARAPILRSGSTRVAAVLRGRVRVFLWAGPRRQVTVGYGDAGQIIGLSQALLRCEDLGAEALTDTTIATLPVVQFRSILSAHPDVAWAMTEWAEARMVDALRNVADGLCGSMTMRVARHLVHLSEATPEGQTVAPVTHLHLAEAVGTAREVVTRAVRELRRDGLVATSPGSIVVLDPEGLARVAAGGRRGVDLRGRGPAAGESGRRDR